MEASFSARGSFPSSHRRGTSQAPFRVRRVGRLTGESVRNLTFMAPNVSGPPGAGPTRSHSPAQPWLHARTPRERDISGPPAPFRGRAFPRARWAGPHATTPPIQAGWASLCSLRRRRPTALPRYQPLAPTHGNVGSTSFPYGRLRHLVTFDARAFDRARVGRVGASANGGEAEGGTCGDRAATALVAPAELTAMRVRRRVRRWIAENVIEDAQPGAQSLSRRLEHMFVRVGAVSDGTDGGVEPSPSASPAVAPSCR